MSDKPAQRVILGLWPRIVAKLKERPDFEDAAVEGIIAGLTATTNVYNSTTKNWDARPDGKTRQETIKLLLAYDEGLPLQRIIQANLSSGVSAKSLSELFDYVFETPELATAFERELEQRKGKKKPAIPAG